jgi:hypothetical protein
MDTLSVSRSPPGFAEPRPGWVSGSDPADLTPWHPPHGLASVLIFVDVQALGPMLSVRLWRTRSQDPPMAGALGSDPEHLTPHMIRWLTTTRLRRGALTRTARWISRGSSRLLHSPKSLTGLRALPRRQPQRAADAGDRRVKRRRGSERRPFGRPGRQRRSAILAYALNPNQRRMPSEQSPRNAETPARPPWTRPAPHGRRSRPERFGPTGGGDVWHCQHPVFRAASRLSCGAHEWDIRPSPWEQKAGKRRNATMKNRTPRNLHKYVD